MTAGVNCLSPLNAYCMKYRVCVCVCVSVGQDPAVDERRQQIETKLKQQQVRERACASVCFGDSSGDILTQLDIRAHDPHPLCETLTCACSVFIHTVHELVLI